MPISPPRHKPNAARAVKKIVDNFYNSSEWRTFRSAVLKERKYQCAVTGCDRRATHLDHIVARKAGGADLDRANVQALCHSHHSSKTVKQDMGREGNRWVRKGF